MLEHKQIEQRTEEWFKQREGKFTASQIHRLLGKEGLKMTNTSIDNYAFEKALESVYGYDEEEVYSKDIERGIQLEPLAFKCFSELKIYQFIDVEECGFIEINKNCGASPDGKCSDNSPLEIKCPRRNKFFKIVANGIDVVDPKYIDQVQMQIDGMEAEKGYFFNYYVEKGIEYWHEIVIPRDQKRIDLIHERVEIASEIRDEYIVKLYDNPQF